MKNRSEPQFVTITCFSLLGFGGHKQSLFSLSEQVSREVSVSFLCKIEGNLENVPLTANQMSPIWIVHASTAPG